LFSQLAGVRLAATRRMALVLASLATLSAALLLAAAPAGAFVSGEFGLQQRKPVWVRYGPLQYHDGPVIHASDSYAIYWDPLELYNSEWMRLIDGYFRNVGDANGSLGNVFAMNSQYGEAGFGTSPGASEKAKEAHAANQSTFRGAYTDTDSYPAGGGNCHQSAEIVCLTDQEIRTELQKVIKSGVLPGTTGTVPGAKSTPVYYILTPPGVTVCAGTETSTSNSCSNSKALEEEAREIKEAKIVHHAETGICGYHSAINPKSATPIVYAVQPWIAGYAGMFFEPTEGPTADVLACQDNSVLEEPNQLGGQNPFAYYGAGLADVIIGDLSDEQNNVVANPLLNAWYQNAAAEEHGYPEQSDMCQGNFGPPPTSPPTPNEHTHAASLSNETIGGGSYYIHWAFNSSGFLTGKETYGCWQAVDFEPHITAPNPVNVGDVIGLNANESGITLDAAPLGLRQGKEETRLAEEVLRTDAEEVDLGDEIAKLSQDATELGDEISILGSKITKLGSEIKAFEGEEESLTEAESELREERRQAEEVKGPLSTAEEKEYAEKEERLAARHKKAAEAKASAEKTKAADLETKNTDEKTKRNDEEHKLVVEEDKRIVKEDTTLVKEEQKLADEHRLIKEREPFLAPIYKWDFGYQENGKEVTEEGEEKASVFHTFPCAKTYTVELTVVDGGGNEAGLPASVTKEITVDGNNPCEEKGSEGGSGPKGGSGSEGGSGTTPGATSPTTSTTGSTTTPSTTTPGAVPPAKPIPGPVASAAVLSRSLTTALKKGLVIGYSVNEQVAGQFQVLLASSVAKRIGLHGAPATDMPPGSEPAIVIAKAILVTTKGGRNTVKIVFGKKTAAKLRKLRSVTLTIRLVVRNASSHSPLSTTVISTVTLSR
jgi:hypothetical protein